MSQLFALCPKCELPVMGKLIAPILCPFCRAPISPEDCSEDYFFNFLDEIRDQDYFEWDDIQMLIQACDILMEINSGACVELAKALRDLDKADKRLAFYAQHMGPRQVS